MNRRIIILLASMVLIVPFLFAGCGSDGSTGPAGATGATGPAGPAGPGVVAAETCALCHGASETFNPTAMHRLNTDGTRKTSGTPTITINSVTFGAPVGDNVPVTVDFTFAATNSEGVDITSQIDLRTRTGNPPAANDNLAFVGFAIAKLVAGTNGDPNEWNGFVVNPTGTGSAPFRTNRPNGVDGAIMTGTPATGVYSYTFPTSAVRVSDGYVDNVVMRVGIQFTSSPSAATPILQTTLDLFTTDPILQQSLNRPVANGVLDVVSGVGVALPPTAAYPTKDVVTTAACNACHDPLAIHGGGRREYKYCQICHNAKTEIAGNISSGGPGWDNTNLVKLVHGVHQSLNLGSTSTSDGLPDGAGNFSEVTYPQDIRNCATCHKGPDGANWKNKPTITGCGSCHRNVNFSTGAGHLAGAQPNATCALCHSAQSIALYHATENSTPNNPVDRPGLVTFQYGIDTVTVDNTRRPVVKFWIKSAVAGADGTLGAFSNLNLGASGDNATRPSGFSGSPSFLVAYGDTAATVADYSNFGRSAGQPASVSLIGLPITGTPAQYTVTLTSAFPAGAKMRAVALQGYFTQTNIDTTIPPDGVNDNTGRHTPAVFKSVTGDAVRRVLVKSGYDNVAGVMTPVGCLECHEVFEGHGGNRVNNVQVCVMCHNPNLTTSGRTIPVGPAGITQAIVDRYGSDPLTYPEVAQNMKELIHGIHASAMRATSFDIIRNRQEISPTTLPPYGGPIGVEIWGDEITYPGNPMHCTKCHLNSPTTYDGTLVAGSLYTTQKVTTGNAAETQAQITAARGTVPNSTDLVNSPIASACGHCHNSSQDISHMLLNGGDIKSTRSTANILPPTLAPDVLATP